MIRLRLLLLLALALAAPATPAAALTCSATVTNINFGTISVRAGAVNQTTGNLHVSCTGALVSPVGVCLSFGAGSGGAEAGLSPRYMLRGDGSKLAYDLSTTSGGAALTELYIPVVVLLGSGSADRTLYGDITSQSVSVGTGSYSSSFTDPADVSMQYGVLACGLLGTSGTVSSFAVTADVTSSCEVDSATLGFGQVPSQVTSPVDADTALQVRCTQNTPYSVRLGLGTGAGVSDPAHRKMASTGGTLDYGLYQDAARTLPWGDQPTNDVSATGTGGTQSFPVYGRVHAGQTVPTGSYADTVIVTVNY